MNSISGNSPNVKVFIRDSFLHDHKEMNSFTEGTLLGVRSIQNKAITFYVLLENGVLFTGLPIHALAHKINAVKKDLSTLQLWDSLSYEFSVFSLSLLKHMRVRVYLNNKEVIEGEYLFSIDFCHNKTFGLSETPDEWKCMHFIKLDDGNFCLYPQNRMLFLDHSLCTKVKRVLSEYQYQVNTIDYKSEYATKDTDNNGYSERYLYEREGTTQPL